MLTTGINFKDQDTLTVVTVARHNGSTSLIIPLKVVTVIVNLSEVKSVICTVCNGYETDNNIRILIEPKGREARKENSYLKV